MHVDGESTSDISLASRAACDEEWRCPKAAMIV
jgi:hypothetical protein